MRTRIALVVGLMLLVSLPASAAEESDPNDSASKLDISSFKAAGQDNSLGTFVITAFERWGSKFLKDANPTTLKIYLDDGSDGDADLVGNFRYVDGTLLFFLHGPDTGSNYEPLVAHRPTHKSVKVRVPLDLTELGSASLSAYARSISSELNDCSGDPCQDRAPDTGGITVYAN
ncbi:MAG: hypothetical protein QOG04_742 [Actinomycetota bacterium]|jgi:hypothetical protein|nr:hypothetical protein [Actinomycetota bacterium]